MRYFNLLLLALVLLFASCKGNDPTPPYVYEANPHYSFGYQEFFGPYYADYGNTNNVISLSLFSDSLKITTDGNLVGYGQYLFLEDIFTSPSDTLLKLGTYTINDSGLPFTVSPGKNDSVDNIVYTIGSTISYFEENQSKSTLKLITGGTFRVINRSGSIYNIVCNFKTNDNLNLGGSFSATLPYFNEAINSTTLNRHSRLIFTGR